MKQPFGAGGVPAGPLPLPLVVHTIASEAPQAQRLPHNSPLHA